jgi:hypothetical protein
MNPSASISRKKFFLDLITHQRELTYSELPNTGTIRKQNIFVFDYHMAIQHPIFGLVFKWSACL